jgi:hypothetical protein
VTASGSHTAEPGLASAAMTRDDSSEVFDGVHVPRRTRRLFLAVALLTLAVYVVSARGLPTTFDEQIILDTTSSLVHGKPYINTPLLNQFPGLAVKRSDGRLAGIYGLGTSIVGAPLYVVGKVVAEAAPKTQRDRIVVTSTMFTNALITAATLFMLMLVCMLLGAPPPGAVIVGLSFALGSYAYPHAITMFTEPGTAFCVLTAVYFAIRASRRGARSDLIACGAFAGAALLFRVSAALFVPLIGLWLLLVAWRAKDLLPDNKLRRMFAFGAWFTAGAVGPLVLLLLINVWRYGSATNFGYALGTATDQSYPIVRGVIGQWFSSGKSIFIFAPIAIIVVCGLVRSVRKMPMEMLLLGAVVVVNTLFFARVQFWSGDWAWGPRYMQIVVPCLAAMAAPLMDSRAWRRALIIVSVFGFFFAALPAVLMRFTLEFYAAYAVMPPPTVLGPPNWDHSYYALVWHTLHWQQILYAIRHLPGAFSNTLNHVTSPFGPLPVTKSPHMPRFEFWWLRARDIGWGTVMFFAVVAVGIVAAGARVLDRYRGTGRASDTSTDPIDPSSDLGAATDSPV